MLAPLGGILVSALGVAAGALACRAPSPIEVEQALLAIPRQAPLREHGLQRVRMRVDLGRGEREEELVHLRVGPLSGRPSRATIVLVHGTPGSLACWTPLVFGREGRPGLAHEHEVVALEVVGHGLAGARGAPYSFERCARWVGAALEALDLRDVVLIGHSYGGELAWRTALDHPERVRALVLIDSSGLPRPDDGWLPEEEAMRTLPFAELGWAISSPARVRSALDPHFSEPAPADLVEELFHACARPDSWRAMVELARDEEGRRAGELGALRQPVLLVWGERDLAYPAERDGRSFEARIPGAELRVLEDCGHYPQEERPEELLDLLAGFARRVAEGTDARPGAEEPSDPSGASMESGQAPGAGRGRGPWADESELESSPARRAPEGEAHGLLVPRAIDFDELAAAGHDASAFLPASLGAEDALPYARRLAQTRLALALTEGEEPRAVGLAELLEHVEREPAALDGLITRLARRPEQEAQTFARLLDRRVLRSSRWDPDRPPATGEGIVLGPVIDRRALGAPWDEAQGTPELLQALVVARADEQAWLDGQGDFARYLDDVGARYRAVRPRAGSWVSTRDEAGRPYCALVVDVRADLPFPFGGFAMPLEIVCRRAPGGELVVDVHARCRDFHWLRGQDHVLPLRKADGLVAGVLVVRRYGFDLARVPDRRVDREAALRSSLGNLVRRAERAFAERGPRPTDARLRFRLTGAG